MPSHASGRVSRVLDISSIQGHIVPTALAFDGQDFFVGNLDTFPIKDGSSKIMKITPDGQLTTVYINLSDILGLAFDGKGRLYVLENTTGNPFPTPGTGKILRLDWQEQIQGDCDRIVAAHRHDLRSGRKPVRLQSWVRSASGRGGTSVKGRCAEKLSGWLN